jgi:hypothetical protein
MSTKNSHKKNSHKEFPLCHFGVVEMVAFMYWAPESAKRTAQNKDALLAVALKFLDSRKDPIVHGVRNVLLTAEVFFRRLDGRNAPAEIVFARDPRRTCGTVLRMSSSHAACGIMQSIFSSAARLRGSMVGKKPGSRAGELKMYWTKPPRWCRRYGY